MKKLISISCLLLGLLFAFNTSTFAQSGDLKIAPGLIYGSEIENLGIKVDGYYRINEDFRAGIDLGYYFPDKTDFGSITVTTNYFSINFNGNYIFHEENELMAYGLAGINILSISASGGGSSSSTSETGLNLGAGVEYALDFGSLFGELKLSGLGGDADQVVLGAGVRFPV
jgi:opacity protein-like surface antigen